MVFSDSTSSFSPDFSSPHGCQAHPLHNRPRQYTARTVLGGASTVMPPVAEPPVQMTKAWAFPSISSSSCSICGWKAVWGPSSTVGEGQAGACPWCVRHGVGRLCMCLCVLLCFIKQYRRRWCIGHRGLPEGSQHPNCTRRRKSFVAGYAGPSLFLTDHSRTLRTASWVVRVRLSLVPGQDRSRKASGQHTRACVRVSLVCLCPDSLPASSLIVLYMSPTSPAVSPSDRSALSPRAGVSIASPALV